ncbi:hypothetical protein VDG1235_3583 [Verrucomicrobiia bacterium DG1235]|nr:hypothetical protein VDG1235_3583 [Verrucomicrobiae bacterium DG1235]
MTGYAVFGGSWLEHKWDEGAMAALAASAISIWLRDQLSSWLQTGYRLAA